MSVHRSIFRPEALQRYVQGSEVNVISRPSRSIHLALLWSMVALCLLSGMIAGLVRVPVYVTSHIVTGRIPMGADENNAASWVILVPVREQSQLRIGQTINLLGRADVRPAKGVISVIEPRAITTESARIRFGLSACMFTGSTESLTVVIADLTRLSSELSNQVETENRYRAEIEVSTKRIGAFFPGIGWWYDR